LRNRPGFPNLRAIRSDHPEVCDNVVWGDEPAAHPSLEASDADWARFDVASGRFYGYADLAIRDFLDERYAPAVVGAVLPEE
jgi:hypothetical protein